MNCLLKNTTYRDVLVLNLRLSTRASSPCVNCRCGRGCPRGSTICRADLLKAICGNAFARTICEMYLLRAISTVPLNLATSEAVDISAVGLSSLNRSCGLVAVNNDAVRTGLLSH